MLWNGCVWTGLLLLCLSYYYSLCSCTLCNMCIFAGVLEQFFWCLQEHHSKSEFLVAVFELISLQTHTFVKSTTGIYYSERYFSLFWFLRPTCTGTAILSFTKWYYSPKHYQLYQFIFLSNEYIDNFTCYGFVYFKTWLNHKLRKGKRVVTWIQSCNCMKLLAVHI